MNDRDRLQQKDEGERCPECGANWERVSCQQAEPCGFEDRVCSQGCGAEMALADREEIRRLRSMKGWTSTPPRRGQSFIVRARSGVVHAFVWAGETWRVGDDLSTPRVPYDPTEIASWAAKGDRFFVLPDDPEKP